MKSELSRGGRVGLSLQCISVRPENPSRPAAPSSQTQSSYINSVFILMIVVDFNSTCDMHGTLIEKIVVSVLLSHWCLSLGLSNWWSWSAVDT